MNTENAAVSPPAPLLSFLPTMENTLNSPVDTEDVEDGGTREPDATPDANGEKVDSHSSKEKLSAGEDMAKKTGVATDETRNSTQQK